NAIGLAIVVGDFLFDRTRGIVFLDQSFGFALDEKRFAFHGAVVEENLDTVGELVVLIVSLLIGVAIFIINLYRSVAKAVNISKGARAFSVFVILGEYTVFYSGVEVAFHHGISVFVVAHVLADELVFIVRGHEINFLKLFFRRVVIGSLLTLAKGNK